ncbi:hypothetical protein Tco_0415705 [Tanacetum coccineum]
MKENHDGWIVVVLGGDDLSSIDDGGGGGCRAALEADAFLAAGDELQVCQVRLYNSFERCTLGNRRRICFKGSCTCFPTEPIPLPVEDADVEVTKEDKIIGSSSPPVIHTSYSDVGPLKFKRRRLMKNGSFVYKNVVENISSDDEKTLSNEKSVSDDQSPIKSVSVEEMDEEDDLEDFINDDDVDDEDDDTDDEYTDDDF